MTVEYVSPLYPHVVPQVVLALQGAIQTFEIQELPLQQSLTLEHDVLHVEVEAALYGEQDVQVPLLNPPLVPLVQTKLLDNLYPELAPPPASQYALAAGVTWLPQTLLVQSL